jgi:hypothetical protein
MDASEDEATRTIRARRGHVLGTVSTCRQSRPKAEVVRVGRFASEPAIRMVTGQRAARAFQNVHRGGNPKQRAEAGERSPKMCLGIWRRSHALPARTAPLSPHTAIQWRFSIEGRVHSGAPASGIQTARPMDLDRAAGGRGSFGGSWLVFIPPAD